VVEEVVQHLIQEELLVGLVEDQVVEEVEMVDQILHIQIKV
jgi:hypothetical protein